MSRISRFSAALAFAVVCNSPIHAAELAPAAGYAERIYSEYAIASGAKIRFDLEIIDSGDLSELHAQPFVKVVGTPAYLIQSDLSGLGFSGVRYGKVRAQSADD